MDEKLGGVITRTDLKNLHDSELNIFDSKHASSQSQDLESRRHLLNGVPMPWMSKRSGSFPVCISRAQGAHLIDIDGNTLVDFCLGDTGALTGHALTEVNEAVSKQLQIGATTMMPSPDAAWIGAELARRFELPLWQLALSATDANRFVIRYARYLTGRPKVAVFDWCYHGSLDETAIVLGDDDTTVQPRAGAVAPVPPHLTTRAAHFNNLASLESALAHGDVACLLMEPAMTNVGTVMPQPGYLDAVREITRRFGVLLVLDETHTICLGPGGATAAWQLSPDFVVVGKPIGGGVPVAAYGMTAEIGARLSAMHNALSDVPTIGGTLTASPLTSAAVRATLTHYLRDEHFQVAIALATQLTIGIQAVIDEFQLPWSVTQIGCRVDYRFAPKPLNGREAVAKMWPELDSYFRLFALNRGFVITPFQNMALLSPFHSELEVRAYIQVFRDTVASVLSRCVNHD